jgi:hypothetical protein
MKYQKLRAGEETGTYVMESPVTEADILQMAQQLAMSRLSKGRILIEPKQVFSHLQTLLQYHEHEVFARLLLDTKHRVIGFALKLMDVECGQANLNWQPESENRTNQKARAFPNRAKSLKNMVGTE